MVWHPDPDPYGPPRLTAGSGPKYNAKKLYGRVRKPGYVGIPTPVPDVTTMPITGKPGNRPGSIGIPTPVPEVSIMPITGKRGTKPY